MGTQVHYKGFLPSYYSMKDLNEDSNSSSWPLFYGDKTLPSGQYCNGFTSRTITDAYPGYDKDILKQKMLEHEAIFRNQVMELHRLYRIQRDMMDEFRRKEMHKLCSSVEPSCSSSHLGSQVPPQDVRKWHITNFPLENSGYTRPSTSGTEIVNSPLSSSKGDGVQPGRVQMQNGYSSIASDVLEARPSKVQKKLFDLQLPADDYIDTEEGGQLRDNAGFLHPSYPANGNYVGTQESGTKLFPGGGGGAKGDSRKDASTSKSCLRNSIGLADLNEPAQLDEATDPVDFLGYGNNHRESRSINASAKSNPPFVALPWNSNCATPNESLSKLYDRGRLKDREWLASAYETGNIKGSSASLPRGLQEDKIPAASHQAPVMINKAYQAPGAHLVHHIKDGIWKDRTGHGLAMSHRNGEQSNYTQVGPFVTSKMASPYPCASSSEFSSSWPHSVSSWEKPNGSFTQRLSSLHTNSFFNSPAAVGKGSQSSQSQIGAYWHANGSSRLRPGCAGELPIRSGFYSGSSSGTKESPIHFRSAGFDSLSHIKGDRFTSERPSNNASENFLISSNNADAKSAKGFNLNVLATSALSEEPPSRDVEFGNEKKELQDPVTVLPWLKAKANGKNEGVNTRIGGTSANSGFVQAYSNPPFCQSDPSALEHHHMKTTKEVGETRHVRKILGIPILDIPVASRNESSSLVSASANLRSSPERETIRHERRSMVIDINVACDLSMVEPEEPAAVEQIVTEKVMETKTVNIRNHFDLNSCITDDEEPVSAESSKANVKIILDIDLEAPVVMDIDQDNFPGEEDKQREASSQLPDHKPEHTQEELLRTAAEAIVAISSSAHCTLIEETHSAPSDDPLESLRWFVDVVSSCAAELDSTSAKQIPCKNNIMAAHSAFKEIDYFEAMTLQLTETKEEDYMPKPFVPEVQTVEDAGASSLTNRPRRGNARRGRQRRDFQRDILPGLASLSRHEVTEDIQIFGGLMRATGHTWNSSLTRRNGTRNGGARGRRKKVVDTTTPAPVLTTTTSSPLMHQLSNIEASLEDKSLTGWGKTPRRPRRQRCPGVNPPAVLLT